MRRLAVLVTTLGIAAGAMFAVGAPASAQTTPRQGDRHRGDPEEIRFAVVANMDNPFAPGLFQGGVNGVKAGVEYVKSHGGVAGRKLEVDFIDSQLDPSKTRNLSHRVPERLRPRRHPAAFMTTMRTRSTARIRPVKKTGLPDFAAFVTGVQQCSPVAYPVNPPQLDCSTKAETRRRTTAAHGAANYLQKLAGTKMHGLYLVSNDSAVATRQQDLLLAFPSTRARVGLASVRLRSAPQSPYTPIVQELKADKSNFAVSAMGSSAVIALRQEAVLQGLDNPKM